MTNATRTPLAGVYSSRYKPKKIWPPDFSKLSQKEQFRFEKRYKRRVKLATARPRWDKYVRLVQLGAVTSESDLSMFGLYRKSSADDNFITGVLIYSVLFMEWNTENQPFQGVSHDPLHLMQ